MALIPITPSCLLACLWPYACQFTVLYCAVLDCTTAPDIAFIILATTHFSLPLIFNFGAAAPYVLLLVDLSSADGGSACRPKGHSHTSTAHTSEPFRATMPLSTLTGDKLVPMMDIDGENLYCSAASQTSFAVTSIARIADGTEIKKHVDVFSKRLLGNEATLEELQYLVQTSRLMDERLSHKLPAATGTHQKEDRRLFLT